MTSAAEIRSHEVSPESTLEGEEAVAWAKAAPARNRLINNDRTGIFFIICLLRKIVEYR
jgi:hypothetical protein